MQMFPDDLPLANIDADGYCCHFMHSSVRPTIRGLGFVYCRQSAWKKWLTIWHADVSRWLTLSIHGCLWILLLVCLSVHLFVYGIFRCQCMSLEEKVYILAYWCIQITYPQFIDAYGYYWPFVGPLGFVGVGVGVGGWGRGGFVTSLGDTGDICCHYWQHIPVLNGRNGLKFDGRNGLKFDMLMYNKYLRGAPKDDGCVVDLRESYRFRTFTCLVLISDVVTELSRVLLWFCFPLAVWSLFIHLVPAV